MVATGRRVASTRDPLAQHGLAPGACVMNGALLLDLATGERVHRHAHEPAAVREVLAAFAAHGVRPCVYVDHPDHDVVHEGPPSTHPGHFASLGATIVEVDLARFTESVPVLMFGVVGHDEPVLHEIAATIGAAAEVHVSGIDQWGGHTITATPLGLSKWDAVTRWCATRGIDATRVLAVGDGPNDLELLDGAAVAVVPRSGCEAALARADHVIDAPEGGGWAQIVDLL
jgi:hydroxymethylpyrimidine pyrophosphatase-like HAD family hydrolase